MNAKFESLREGSDIPEKLLDSKTIFKGRMVNLKIDEVELPDGQKSTREVITHPGAVVIIPVRENGNIVFVRQYRHAINNFVLELPAGKLDHPGENLEECARRELLEETKYDCKEINKIFEFYSSPGMTDEKMNIFAASGLTLKKYDTQDYDEFISRVEYPLEEALEMVKHNKIIDGKTVIGLLYYSNYIKSMNVNSEINSIKLNN